MRMIRRWKGDMIKSRLCLQDVAYTRAIGGELYAATPSLTALRASLTLAIGWKNLETNVKVGALAADVTQAFVHADMDEKIITRIPRDMHGMEVTIQDTTTRLEEGDWLLVQKALYGYRKSPQLWQKHFFTGLQNLKCASLKCLESEPALCADMSLRVLLVVHVDDVLMLGNFEKCEEILKRVAEIHQDSRERAS